jgi:hypothetical protein
MFHILGLKLIWMWKMVDFFHKYVANILWKHVIWFRMNLMMIKYWKTFIKHYKDFYF